MKDNFAFQSKCEQLIYVREREIKKLLKMLDDGKCDHSVTEWSCYHDQEYCSVCDKAMWDIRNEEDYNNDE